jgi:hypothetical protein
MIDFAYDTIQLVLDYPVWKQFWNDHHDAERESQLPIFDAVVVIHSILLMLLED